MAAWEYKREESNNFEVIPEGKHRVRIDKAERTVSKSGKDMIALTLAVSGYNSSIFHYIVFLPDRPEITNRNLTQLFDAFTGITPGDFDVSHWEGKAGACVVKHEEYNGNTNAKVRYFLKADKAKDLPEWKEPSNSTKEPAPTESPVGNGFVNVSESDLPIW